MSLQSLAQQHRAAILARERQAARAIASQYKAAWQRLSIRLQQLLDQMQAAQQQAKASNTPFNGTVWWAQFHRLDSLLASANSDFGTFANTAAQIVRDSVGMAVKAGEADALALLDAKLGKAPGLVFGRPSEAALKVLVNRGASNTTIADLFARMNDQTKALVRKRLVAGLTLGQGPQQVARDLASALKYPLNKALLIARSEMMNAYRTAALQTYRANRDVVTGWRWLASLGACPDICAPQADSLHSLDEGMETHTGCRCTPAPETVTYADLGFTNIEEAA